VGRLPTWSTLRRRRCHHDLVSWAVAPLRRLRRTNRVTRSAEEEGKRREERRSLGQDGARVGMPINDAFLATWYTTRKTFTGSTRMSVEEYLGDGSESSHQSPECHPSRNDAQNSQTGPPKEEIISQRLRGPLGTGRRELGVGVGHRELSCV
jgi:hypothetical protein